MLTTRVRPEAAAAGPRPAAIGPVLLAPTAFVLANAVAFYLLRPGVPDLWAARARASAAGHGVGVTYWFGWFDGSSPGNYSVIAPLLSSALGTELVAGLAAVATCAAATVLVRATPRPVASAWTVAVAVIVNLWCGRVPFLIGAALGVTALLLVTRRRAGGAAAVTALCALASPVAGAFLGLGLSGALLTPRARALRRPILVTVGAAGATLITLAVLFGTPGPEPLPPYLLGEILLVLGLLWLTGPPDHLRATLAVSAVAAVVLFAVPNGMGANLARLALFCLPPAAVALSRRRAGALALLTAPIVLLALASSVSAVVSATRPSSTVAYYAPLSAELDSLRPIDQRLEVVNAGHAAYAVLLDHAVLARGWETQEDAARNGVLQSPALDARSYRAWLDDNAVGYVALVAGSSPTPESKVVRDESGGGYLHEIWRSARWRLYEVRHPTPIVAVPAVLVTSTQSAMTVRVPCACRTTVRVRWSRFLEGTAALARGVPDAVGDRYRASVTADPAGWTVLTTARPGTYVLAGT